RSIVGYRLYLAPGVRAALTFYSDWPHAFDELAIACGSIFAAYCSPMVFTEDVLGLPSGSSWRRTRSTSPRRSTGCTGPGGGCVGRWPHSPAGAAPTARCTRT